MFLSIIGIALEEIEGQVFPINPTIIRVMRVLRIARVLKLLKMAKGIRALLDTVMQALPQVGNLGLLFFLLFFIFSALGVELFGRLECDSDHPCQAPAALHRHWASGHTSELATRNCNFLILIPAAAQCRAAANYGNICAAPGNSLCLHSNSLRPSVAIAMHWN